MACCSWLVPCAPAGGSRQLQRPRPPHLPRVAPRAPLLQPLASRPGASMHAWGGCIGWKHEARRQALHLPPLFVAVDHARPDFQSPEVPSGYVCGGPGLSGDCIPLAVVSTISMAGGQAWEWLDEHTGAGGSETFVVERAGQRGAARRAQHHAQACGCASSCSASALVCRSLQSWS